MKTAAIIQARMGSTRLPGKVLAEVVGQPMLFHVVNRARRARTLDGVIVATSDSQADDVVSQFCREVGVTCFRGSEADVLDRYYQAARHFDIATIVRLTADCPLLDPLVVDRVVQAFETGGCDFVSNTFERSFPDGLDTEVFSRDALERAGEEVRKRLAARAVVITRGSKGMALFEASGMSLLPVHGTDQIADVTGAGDTVIATFTLALAAGASYGESAHLANIAGGIVVMKRGTATVSSSELAAAVVESP